MTITQRLIEFYRKYGADPGNTVSPIWTGIVQVHQAQLCAALSAGDTATVENILDGHGSVLHGLEMPDIYEWGKPGANHLLNRLGRRVGLIPVQNPEQPSPSTNWECNDMIVLKSELEKILGPMGVPNGFVFPCTDTGVPIMHFFKLGQWFTIKSFMEPQPQRVLEIGAGTGGLAVVAHNNGITDYTIIDIPSVAVISAYYLAKAFGEDKLWLCGEDVNSAAVFHSYPHHFHEGLTEYDLIININSFPEMTVENQDGYMRLVESRLAVGGYFYSCNHESDMANQSRVFAAVQRNGNFKLAYRAPSILREGYLEEFYRRK